MTPTVIVNKLAVVHKDSDGVVAAAAPDSCKTPPNMTPMAYPNVTFSKDLAKGSVTVFADGQSIALKGSVFKTSTGDEAGSGGGLLSGVNKGSAKFSTYSNDVKVEGKNVARLGDKMLMNGNNPNTSGVETQNNRLPDDLDDLICTIFCWCNQDGAKGGDLFKEKPSSPYTMA